MEQSRRLFISGIPPKASEDEIKKRFEPFGAVASVEKLVKSREGFPTKCFAYLDISLTDTSYRKCVAVYSKAKWKGNQMTIEPAKKSFLKCLEDERQQCTDNKKPTKALSPPPSIVSELQVKSRDGKCLLNINLKKNAKRVKKFAGQSSSSSDQVSINDLSWDFEPGSEVTSENSPPAKNKKLKEDKRSKSNKVRLKALEKTKEQCSKAAIVDKPKVNSHVVFEPEEEAESSMDESSSNIPKGKTPLPLFGSDSENDDIDNNVVRPQFEGEEGAKLFKLQQKIGWDKRFELDKRFLSSDDGSASESEESTAEQPVEQDTDNDGELKKEQQRNLELINEMFGITSSVVTPKAHTNIIKLQRYDPSAADSELLENKPTPAKPKKKKAVSPTANGTTVSPNVEAEETPKPVVSQDHYYSVSDTLKDVLKPDNKGYAFNFASSSTKDDNSSQTADTSMNTPSWISALQNDEDSSSSEEDISDLPPASNNVQKRTNLFFFHANSPQLRNRLDAPETQFHRTCSLEELETKWPEKRTRLKEQYKRRRRDALRWLRQRKQLK